MLIKPAFALPSKDSAVPSSATFIHEVKHDGYRLMVIRDGMRVQLRSKGSHDFAKCYLWIVESALRAVATAVPAGP